MKLGIIARIQLTVSNFEACASFYGELMNFLEMSPVFEDTNTKYWAGQRTAVVISRCGEAHRSERFVPERVGLHHLCFRVRTREDVDRAHELVLRLGARIASPPGEWPWAPGYYAVRFADPDGIRLEVSHARGYLDETMTVPIPRPGQP